MSLAQTLTPPAGLPPGMDCADERQCLAFLAGLPLTDPARAQERLAALVAGMERRPPPPESQLRILETARSALDFVQTELGTRYSMRPLPPGGEGDAVLGRVVSLWQAMARAYAAVAREGASQPQVQGHIALICQRCLFYSSQVVIEYFRARREVRPGAWSEVHGYYLTAEEMGIAATNVASDVGGKPRYESCLETYCALLLIDLSNPNARTPREFAWTCRWARRFSRVVAVGKAESSKLPVYGVDLNLDDGAQPIRQLNEGYYLRQLGMERLKEGLQGVLARLQHGADPVTLGLGKDTVQPAVNRLMMLLFRSWCMNPRSRRFPRHSGGGEAETALGFEAIHHQVTGTRFLQPGYRRSFSRAEAEALVTLGALAEAPETEQAPQGYIAGTEIWRVVDEAVSGFRLRRDGTGAALTFGDLIGMRLSGSEQCLLCRVSWVMYRGDGALQIGVFLLPGAPRGVSVRPGEGAAPDEPWVPAFLLPGMEALKEAPSLVLPRGWFKPQRVLEVHAIRPFRVRLETLGLSGNNFDRVSFTPL